MNILAISTLFPTPDMPNHGVFVYNRLNAMAKEEGVSITVINPLPWSFIHPFFDKYNGLAKCPPKRGPIGELTVYHPRYFSIPGILKFIECNRVEIALWDVITKLMGKGEKFDRIDVHWTYPDLPAAINIAKKLNIPCSVTLRGMEAFYAGQGDLRERQISNALRNVDCVISLSQEMADYADVIANTGKRTEVIRNGVDTETFSYMPMQEAREVLGIPKEQEVLLSVGSLIKRKGFHHVIESMSVLIKANPGRNFHYYIIGSTGLEGDFQDSLDGLIEKHGLRERVHFVGQITNNNLHYWYNAVDLFCLASFGEGSPNVLTEALSCGCPAVASGVGSVSEIMASEDNLGLVIPNQEKSTLFEAGNNWAHCILETISKKQDRSETSKKMKKYTWEKCAQQVIQVFKK